jgi:hypothetical protein
MDGIRRDDAHRAYEGFRNRETEPWRDKDQPFSSLPYDLLQNPIINTGERAHLIFLHFLSVRLTFSEGKAERKRINPKKSS